MCFEAKSAIYNKLSMTYYKCILIFKFLWTTKEGQQESANYWGQLLKVSALDSSGNQATHQCQIHDPLPLRREGKTWNGCFYKIRLYTITWIERETINVLEACARF